MLSNILKTSLILGIPTTGTAQMEQADINKLMQSYQLMLEAQDSLLAQEITFDEYLQLCEVHDFNVDSYLQTVENNLTILRVL